MKRVKVCSVEDAFSYVMSHYYPFGMEEFAERKDSYAVISIQDTHTGGFGVEFRETNCCKGVLTLYFDDVYKEVPHTVSFSREMAEQVIDFLDDVRQKADTLLIHCYAGQSRSRAVGAFAVKHYGGDNKRYFETGSPNQLVYHTLVEAEEGRLKG